MVYSVERKERVVRGSGSHYDVDDREEEDGGSAFVMERSKPPLHNFNLPFLKWGNQKHLRCMKAPDSTTAAENGGGGKYDDGRFSIASDVSADRHRRNRSPPPSRFGGGTGNYDVRRFRPPRFGGGGGEEGIEAVREKLMLDLKAQADKMKNQILRRNQVSDDDDDDSDEEEEEDEHEDEGDKKQERKLQSRPQSQSPIPAPPVAAAPAAADKSQEEARPWNLRTRRAACKAPTLFGGNSAATAKGRIEEKKGSSSNNNNNSSPLRSDGAKSPRLRGDKREREEKEKERPKFSVGLSKKEIEEDFMQMLGHRPARRPKKRPRAVQRQLDTLFPGLWLTEVSADAYKVPEIPETGKR